MTAPRDLGQGPGEIRRRPRFNTNTPGQLRQFIALTLAQMVHLEDMGIIVTSKAARRQALDLLDIPTTQEGRRTPVDELIARLRDRALEASRLAEAEAPTKAVPPQ
jgi:hypothetical protein